MHDGNGLEDVSSKMHIPSVARIHSAKYMKRPDSACSKFTAAKSLHTSSIRPTSGRPTTANTQSKIS